MKSTILLIAVGAINGCSLAGTADQALMRRATGSIANLTRDPESVRFRDVAVRKFTSDSGELREAVCGEANAKNLMGGYIGYTAFHYTEPSGDKPFASMREPLEDNRSWDAAHRVYCEGANAKLIAEAFNEEMNDWAVESARNLQSAHDEYNELIAD